MNAPPPTPFTRYPLSQNLLLCVCLAPLHWYRQACNKAARDAQHAKDSLAADLVGARARWEAREAALNKVHYSSTHLEMKNMQNTPALPRYT